MTITFLNYSGLPMQFLRHLITSSTANNIRGTTAFEDATTPF